MRGMRWCAGILGATLLLAMAPMWLAAQVAAPTSIPGEIVLGAPTTSATNPITGPETVPLSKPPTTMVTVNFRDAQINDVLDFLSEKAGYIVVKLSPVSGRINLVAKSQVSSDDLPALIDTALEADGFGILPMGRILKVDTRENLVNENLPVRYGIDPNQIADTDQLITQIIPLKTIDATRLRSDLLPILSATAIVTSNPGANVIIITDSSSNIKRAVQICLDLDQQVNVASSMFVRHLLNADAQTAATLITTMFPPPAAPAGAGGGGGAAAAAAGPGAAAAGGRGGAAAGTAAGGRGGGRGGGGGGGAAAATPELEGQKVIAGADERSNNVVVSGPASTLAIINKLLDQMDADTSQATTFFLYKVKNGQAQDMAATLNALFNGTSTGTTGRSTTTTGSRGTTIGTNSTGIGASSGGGLGGGGGGGGGRGGTGGGRGGGTGGGGGGGLGGGGGGGSLGGGGLGSTGGGGGRGGTGGSTLGSTGGTGGGGGTRAGGTSGLASVGTGTGGADDTNDLTGAAFVVPDVDTNSLLVAVVTKFQPEVETVIRELDRPVAQVLIKVLVAEVDHDDTSDFGMDFSALNMRTTATSNNGQRAAQSFGNLGAFNSNGGLLLQVTESNVQAALHALAVQGKLDVLSRPYILCSDNQVAEITVGQSVPIITNSTLTTLGQTQNTIQYQSVGIILYVQPHVNQDGLVTCLVEPEVSSLSDQTVPISSNGLTAPVFNTRTAQTQVAIQNGQTIVIGGMIGDQKSLSFQKVPLLGDIPLLGPLFGRTQYSDTKTELLIFMTPHVALRPEFLLGQTNDEMKGVTDMPTLADPLELMSRGDTTLPAPEDVVDPFLMQQEIKAQDQRNQGRGGAQGVGPIQSMPQQLTPPPPVGAPHP